jgi:hypothetical protein
VVCSSQGFEGGEDGGPGGGAVGFEVDEEVEGLSGVGVEDAVLGGSRGEGGEWVLAVEGV